MTTPADHTFLERLLRVEECLLAGRPVDADAAPEALAIIRAYRTGKNANEAIGIQTAPGDRKEPHSIEYMLERFVRRMEHAADRAERAAEHLVHLAGQRPGVEPLLALTANEMSSRDAAMEIGIDPQTVRNWLHKNPSLGCFRDGRWIVFRDALESLKRVRFPHATDRKLSR